MVVSVPLFQNSLSCILIFYDAPVMSIILMKNNILTRHFIRHSLSRTNKDNNSDNWIVNLFGTVPEIL